MQVYMRLDEIQEINRYLDALPAPIVVLEWGSGGSSVTFSQHKNVQHWTAVEHDEAWYVKMRRFLDQGKNKTLRTKITLLLAKERDEYLAEPYGGRFDLIIVDGRWRPQCLDLAPQYLATEGAVLLHDCDRHRYQEAIQQYASSERLSYGDKRHQGLLLLWPDDDPDQEPAYDEMSFAELQEYADSVGAPRRRSAVDQVESIRATLSE